MENSTKINYEGEDVKGGANNCIKEKISTRNMILFSVYSNQARFLQLLKKQSEQVLLTRKIN